MQIAERYVITGIASAITVFMSVGANSVHEPINPYAPPQSPVKPVLPPFDSRRLSHERYLSSRFKAQVAIGATAFTLLLNVLMVGSLFMQIAMLNAAGTALDMAAAEANDRRQLIISYAVMGSLVINLIALLVWIYAAQKNLPALWPSKELEFSPGWSVGWFFIPIANLFKPFQAVRQLWNESHPDLLVIGTGTLPIAPPATLVGWWWGLRIMSAIAGRVLMRVGDNSTIEGLLSISWVAIGFTLALDVPLLVCQWQLIARTQRNQEQRYAKILRSQSTPQTVPSNSDNPLAMFSDRDS